MGFTSVSDYSAGKMDWLLNGLPVEGALAGEARAVDVAEGIPTCAPDDRLAKLSPGRRPGEVCVVVNHARAVLGTVTVGDPGGDARVAADAMDPAPLTFRPGVPAAELATHLREHDLPSVLLTTAEGRLVGIVRVEDLESVSAASGRRSPAG